MSKNAKSYTVTKHQIILDDQAVFYRHYHYPDKPKRNLLLLHGAGVAGDLTWQYIINYLNQWSDIFVPDLRGMGETTYPDQVERAFSHNDVLQDLVGLLKHISVWKIDIGGYSFGGLIAMLLKQLSERQQAILEINKIFLFESALLYGLTDAELIHARDKYHDVVKLILEKNESEQAINLFINLITPKHLMSDRNQRLIKNRLLHRPVGFAYAINCVNACAHGLSREDLLKSQQNVSSFAGSNSDKLLHDIHEQLAKSQREWLHHLIDGSDHALVFQKPRQIAKLMNQDLQDFLAKKIA